MTGSVVFVHGVSPVALIPGISMNLFLCMFYSLLAFYHFYIARWVSSFPSLEMMVSIAMPLGTRH